MVRTNVDTARKRPEELWGAIRISPVVRVSSVHCRIYELASLRDSQCNSHRKKVGVTERHHSRTWTLSLHDLFIGQLRHWSVGVAHESAMAPLEDLGQGDLLCGDAVPPSDCGCSSELLTAVHTTVVKGDRSNVLRTVIIDDLTQEGR